MHVSEEDTAILKKWIVKRLEDISDADSDVLADYVLALVKTDDADEQVRQNCLENLEDFLREHTATFVEDVLNAIRTRSYLPGYSAPQPLSATAPPFNPPSGPSNISNQRPGAQGYQDGTYNGMGGQSRKRTYNDRAGSESRDGRDPHYGRGAGGDRAQKQMRRGGNRGVEAVGMRGGRQAATPRPLNLAQNPNATLPGLGALQTPQMPQMAPLPQMPTPPPGFPPIDPNNPLSAILAMQAMGFPPLPGMPPLPMAGSPTKFGQSGSPTGFAQAGSPDRNSMPAKKVGERCQDYDTKGFCVAGSLCPYEHGQDPVVVPGQNDEYDPNKSSLMMDVQPTNGQPTYDSNRGGDRGRGRGRGRGDRGGHTGGRGGRAPFSSTGPNHDRSIKAIVVEQIPEEKFTEQAVRDFFSEFGTITKVDMQAYKRLALVEYDDYYAARAAYQSPKTIFDNRFVKVYWYKPNAAPTAPAENGAGTAGDAGTTAAAASPIASAVTNRSDEPPPLDMVEFERKQAEAQRAHDEKMRKLQETDAQKAAIEAKLKAAAEERRRMLEQIAAKTTTGAGAGAAAAAGGNKNRADSPRHAQLVVGASTTSESDPAATAEGKKSAQTEALRAKLAELEAEAASMGINPDEPAWPASGYGRGSRGRGVYRGRGGYVPRGRGYDPYRGSYRGRGGGAAAFGGSPRGGAVMRLDNRPKSVEVRGVEAGSGREEALRAYLFNNFEIDSYAVEPHPEKPDAQVVTFKERYVAENFITSSTTIPNIGKVELSWAHNMPRPLASTPATGPSATNTTAGAAQQQQQQQQNGSRHDGDVAMGEAGGAVNGNGAGGGAEQGRQGAEVEYDVADDDDRWGG